MSDFFARRGAVYINEMNQSLGALVGIAQGVLSDQHLNDNEIHYLNDWLSNNEVISTSWPGDVIHRRVRSVIADGVITMPLHFAMQPRKPQPRALIPDGLALAPA